MCLCFIAAGKVIESTSLSGQSRQNLADRLAVVDVEPLLRLGQTRQPRDPSLLLNLHPALGMTLSRMLALLLW